MARFDYLPTEEDRQNAFELAKQVAAGTWVLFAGAGVSVNCGLPAGKELVNRLETALELAGETLDRNNLPEACSRYAYTRGRQALDDFLRVQLDTKGIEPSPVHHRLLDLDPGEILTTNPEDLFEKTLDQRGRPYCTIVQGADWSMYSSREQLPLLKLHGDLRRPGTLVFTQEDYDESIKDGILQGGLVEKIARFSICFVGYSLGDHDLNRVLKWVSNQLGSKSRPHFIVQDRIEEWKRLQLADKNIKVIQLGNYDCMEQFLIDLAEEADSLKPSPRTPPTGLRMAAPPLEQGVILELFQDRYEPARAAIEAWHLTEAEQRLRELVAEIDRVADRIDVADELRDFRQRLMLALATVLHWRGRPREALQLWQDVKRQGPLGPDRRLQASVVLANLRETRELEGLLSQYDQIPQRGKVMAILRWQQERFEEASNSIPEETDDVDLATLKARVALSRVTEETAEEAERYINRAWALAEGLAPAMAEVAGLSDQLLRRIVLEGCVVPSLDRRALIRVIRERYRSAVKAFEPLATVFPEGLIAALAGAMSFHHYLDEEEAVKALADRLRNVQGVTRERAVAEYLLGETEADLETIELLFQQGFLTRGEWSVLRARYLMRMDQPDKAEEVLRDTLAIGLPDTEREPALEALFDLMVSRGRMAEAEALLEGIGQERPELATLMQAMVVRRAQGPEAAISFLRAQLPRYPRSPLLLENIVRLLIQETRGKTASTGDGSDKDGQ